MSQTLKHTEILNCTADDAWECCKNSHKVLPDILPEYFAKAEILEGYGGPGSVRALHLGPAIPLVGVVKERLDKVDDATRTLSYTVLEGDPRYKSCSAEVQFVPKGEKQTEATWTAKYDPVGDAGVPQHLKEISIRIFKAFERAAEAKRTVTHTEILHAPPDAIWDVVKQENTLLPRALPEIFESITLKESAGLPGTIRVCRMGSGIPNAGEVVERLDVLDNATRTVCYTVISGDPRFKHVSAVMHFAPGPTPGTTTASWTAKFVPVEENATIDNKVVVAVWRAFESAAAKA